MKGLSEWATASLLLHPPALLAAMHHALLKISTLHGIQKRCSIFVIAKVPSCSSPALHLNDIYEKENTQTLSAICPKIFSTAFRMNSFIRVPEHLSLLKRTVNSGGCIGTILPTRSNLAEEICANAVSAGTHDPRFSAVETSELDELVYDVDVLSTPERISLPDELDPARYGVIVSTLDGRRGLLLPDLDGVNTVDEQLSIAARKGGIDLADSNIQLERFTVTRYV